MGGYTLQMRDMDGRWKRWWFPASDRPGAAISFDNAAKLAGNLIVQGWALICLTYQEPEPDAPLIVEPPAPRTAP